MTSGGIIFEPFHHRGREYPNRIVLSPLTRARAADDGTPGPLQAEYYRQRADAGLLMSEAIAVLPEGRGGAWTPGLYSEAQVDRWRLTTDAVHQAGGRIFAQLWHAGRLSHSTFHPQGLAPASPVAIAAEGKVHIGHEQVAYETPRALSDEEIEATIAAYRQAAGNAVRAGFDGIEVHGAHGYLLDSFLRDAINDRTDQYGNSLENRARFLVEVVATVADVIGPDTVGVRLSPDTTAGGMHDSDPDATFGYVIDRMNALGIGWLDLVEGDNMSARSVCDGTDIDALIQRFKGAVILNHGYTLELASAAIEAGRADMIAFGRPFIANPDLVDRFRNRYPLAEADRSVWYGGAAAGLTDFPRFKDSM